MFRHWLDARKARREFVTREAEVFLLLYGESAYGVARSRQASEPIYHEVRRLIGKLQKRQFVDTGTRYLSD